MAILQRNPLSRPTEERLRATEWRPPAAAEAGEEFDDAAEPRVLHRVGSTTMVVALMVVVAIVGLYSMRNLGSLSAATMLPREVEALVASVLAPKADPQPGGEGGVAGLDDHGIFGRLDADLRLRLQVPLASLGRNPFEAWRDPAAVPARAMPVAAPPRNGEAEAWDREMDRIGGLLQLKSTLGGGSDRAMANINGRLIRLGDVFAVETADAEFRVERIDLDEVALRARNSRLGTSREIVIRVHRGF